MPTTVAIVSDTHINSTVALCPPTVNLDDGGTYRSSKTQRWLWDCWQDYWLQISKLPGRKIAIFNGDLAELDTKRRTNQIITANKSTIMSIVLECLELPMNICDGLVFIRGTQAHVGKAAWIEESTANDLDNTIRCDKEAPASFYHFQKEIDGVRFDVAHHVSMGRLPWTEKDAANKLSVRARYRYFESGMKPPSVIIRSHNHRYADSGGNFKTFAVCAPSYCARTEYVFRIGQEMTPASIGGIYFICENGKYKYEYIPYEPRKVLTWQSI